MPCFHSLPTIATRRARQLSAIGACAAALVIVVPSLALAEGTVQRSLTVRADVSSRTSLKVSTEVLRFDVQNATLAAGVSLDFSAGARTQAGGEVLLIVEPLDVTRISPASQHSDGAGPAVASEAVRHGTVDVSTPGPKVAIRWVGSGLRRGTVNVIFRSSQPGRYEVPIRVMLAAP